jgi:hypothetical protein
VNHPILEKSTKGQNKNMKTTPSLIGIQEEYIETLTVTEIGAGKVLADLKLTARARCFRGANGGVGTVG